MLRLRLADGLPLAALDDGRAGGGARGRVGDGLLDAGRVPATAGRC